MTNRFSVGYLLEISQFAENFYPLIHGLSGRDILYKNPGTSLRSFAVANCYSRLIDLDSLMMETLEECKSFWFDEDVRTKVEEAMKNRPYEILNMISDIGGSPDQVHAAEQNLNKLLEKFNAIPKTDDDYYIQGLLELKGAVAELTGVYESMGGKV